MPTVLGSWDSSKFLSISVRTVDLLKQSALGVLETSKSILCGFHIRAPVSLCHTDPELTPLTEVNGLKLSKVRVSFQEEDDF